MPRKAFLGALSLLGACAATPPPTVGTDKILKLRTPASSARDRATVSAITLADTGCYSFCPTFTVTVEASGALRYDGQRHVAVKGERSAAVDPAIFSTIRDYLELWRPLKPGAYGGTIRCDDGYVTDGGSYVVSWRQPDGTRSINADRGCRSVAAAELREKIGAALAQLPISQWAAQRDQE